MSDAARLPADSARPAIDRRRYRRVRWFFAKTFVYIFWCDFLLRLPVLRLLRGDPVPRWRGVARRYRALAVEMGGVLIKLGQYLSTRVDLLPPEVTRELAGLQDEVPAAPLAPIVRQIEEDFGRPLGELFAEFVPEPLGAASLAQVHAARLHDGRRVVVKALRPRIELLVATDLAAIALAIRWLKWWGFLRRRVDLDWFEQEFRATTLRELDMQAEGRHAERFAGCFADDRQVIIPEIFWEYSARRTLTEENVGAIKVGDVAAMRAAGIDPAAVARKVYRVYMQQIFVHDFVHCDPHPGNLFVHPAAGDDEADGPTPFRVAFVDFGMVAEIPQRLRAALKLYLIGLGTRNAAKVIQAFRDAGTLLPGADLVRLEEALEAIFDRFWGVEMERITDLVVSEATPLWREFGRLLLETPIQVQVDLMFTGRAAELVIGLATSLDESFNPWLETAPFAERLATEAADIDWRGRALELAEQARLLLTLPGEVSRVATLARRGRLSVRTALASDARKHLERLERSADRLGTAVLAAALLVAGAVLYGQEPLAGAGMMGVAAVLFLGSRLLR